MAYKMDLKKSIEKLVGYLKKSEIVKIFKKQNISVSTIYRTIKDCENSVPIKNKSKSGRPRILDQKNVLKLVASAKDTLGTSTRNLARKYSVSHMTIQRELKRNAIVYRKRKKVPKYTANQMEKVRSCCRELRMKHFTSGKVIILDDEKYFTYGNSKLSGNDGFYTDDYQSCPERVKYKGQAKYEPKVLVWCAISEAGISEAFIGHVKAEAVTADVYIQKCLPKLAKFIEYHHSGEDVIFWPDLASCHYAKKTQEWLQTRNINFVPKRANPPNLPQARPIENFWGMLSHLVYADGWEANSEKQLRMRINRKLKEVTIDVIQAMMRNIKSKLRKIEDNGPLAVI